MGETQSRKGERNKERDCYQHSTGLSAEFQVFINQALNKLASHCSCFLARYPPCLRQTLSLVKCGLPSISRRASSGKLRKLPGQNCNSQAGFRGFNWFLYVQTRGRRIVGYRWIHFQRTKNSFLALLSNSGQVLTATLNPLLAFGAGVGIIVWVFLPVTFLQSVMHHGKGFSKACPRHKGDTFSVPQL